MTQFRPLLACDISPHTGIDLRTLRFPYIGSFKIDAWRSLTMNGPVTRKLKPIPNEWVRDWMSRNVPEGLDGELTVRKPNRKFLTTEDNELRNYKENYYDFNDVQSKLSTHAGMPEFQFLVFDHWQRPVPYLDRYIHAGNIVRMIGNRAVRMLPFFVIKNYEDLMALEGQALGAGYEGICLRRVDGHYKHGRSTLNEHLLLKLKRTADDEAKVIGFEPRYENQNERTTNALGLSERGSSQDNLVPIDMLGALVVWHPKFGTFNIGTGFDTATAIAIWHNRPEFLHQWCTFTYIPYGIVDKPRSPVFKGFRHPAT